MRTKKLNKKFYNQPTLKIARELLGKFLVYKTKNKLYAGKIVETEAYVGPNDQASHASKGRTPRTELMFDSGGHVYIYLIYGMHYCFNIVTENKNYPAAVLVRALEPSSGFKKNDKTDGPGKLCKAMKLNKKMNGADLTKNIIWIEDRSVKVRPKNIARKKRIGVDYAGNWKDKLWRFYIKDNPYVSKK